MRSMVEGRGRKRGVKKAGGVSAGLQFMRTGSTSKSPPCYHTGAFDCPSRSVQWLSSRQAARPRTRGRFRQYVLWCQVASSSFSVGSLTRLRRAPKSNPLLRAQVGLYALRLGPLLNAAVPISVVQTRQLIAPHQPNHFPTGWGSYSLAHDQRCPERAIPA